MSDEKRLIKHLLENYEKVGLVGRPVYNTSETVRVNYGLALIQILDLDEKNQVLTTNVWSRYVSITLFPSYSVPTALVMNDYFATEIVGLSWCKMIFENIVKVIKNLKSIEFYLNHKYTKLSVLHILTPSPVFF